MEVVEVSEAFTEVSEDLEFAHTKIILRQNEEYYYAVTKERYSGSPTFDLDKFNATKIPNTAIWPSAPENLKIAPTPLQHNHFIKRPSLLDFGDNETLVSFSDLILHEVLVYEKLETTPHMNIGRYFGCIVDKDKIKGICLGKYDMTLTEYLRRDYGVNHRNCWVQIRDGVRHLHRLGFVHCDLTPNNIMMNGDTPVIIDFDSCRKEGEDLGIKGGTRGWISSGIKVAERQIDEQSLDKLWQLMCPNQQPPAA